ncbi:hypothetical protein [Massilia sp. TN1-12]|uniref:hypothetical protein n=1 Tax=Massilia paldalensis TaxID=3377675 RepID=UPI00384B4024
MRIQHILAFAAAATLSLTACADPSITPSALSTNLVTVQGSQAPVHRLSPDEAAGMNGLFRLDDGRVMKVTNQSAKLFMELDGKREELVATGSNKFVGRHSGTSVAFDQVPFADEVVVGQVAGR